VVYAASGFIGWADLWWGILLYNPLDEKPIIRFAALLVPKPGETPTDFEFDEYLNP
jgi:hypothetical protein